MFCWTKFGKLAAVKTPEAGVNGGIKLRVDDFVIQSSSWDDESNRIIRSKFLSTPENRLKVFA